MFGGSPVQEKTHMEHARTSSGKLCVLLGLFFFFGFLFLSPSLPLSLFVSLCLLSDSLALCLFLSFCLFLSVNSTNTVTLFLALSRSDSFFFLAPSSSAHTGQENAFLCARVISRFFLSLVTSRAYTHVR